MGGGNGCKSNEARKRAQEKKDSQGKVTTTEDRKKLEQVNNAFKCTNCLQGFRSYVKIEELQDHIDSKHSKLGKTVADLFPNFVATAPA